VRIAKITVLIVLLGAVWANAQPSLLGGVGESKLPIEIDSERMELRGKENIVIFSGSVLTRRGDVDLSSDRLVVYMVEGGGDVEKIEAEGNVRIRKGDILVAGQRGVFVLAEESFVITGKPRMWRGRDVVEGESIRLNLTDETVNVEDARIIMFPTESTGDAAGDDKK
jgi:lipopolysaccharide export system protein LptA